MANENKRLYKGRDIDMLTTLSIIITNAQANQAVLQKKRTNLTKEYLTDLETRLDAIIKDNLGVDDAKQLRQQTIVVYGLQDKAYKAASEMKSQVESSYTGDKSRQQEVLTELGYTSYFKDAQKDDTEALINLLYQYQVNMTPALRNELTKAGTPSESIDAVTADADTLRNANISQESFKGAKKALTAQTLQAYNDIFQEVMGKISKLARVFFPGSLPQQQLVSYNSILKSLNKPDPKSLQQPSPGA